MTTPLRTRGAKALLAFVLLGSLGGSWFLAERSVATANAQGIAASGGSSNAVLLTGNQTVAGNKTFSGTVVVGNTNITSSTLTGTANVPYTFASGQQNGAAAIGFVAQTGFALSTVGTQIWCWGNGSATCKLGVGKNGQLVAPTGNADSTVGTATLVGGTVTVNTTAVGASSLIFVSRNTAGGTTGDLRAASGSIVAATSFVITSASGTDTSTVNWHIIN